MVNLMQHRFYGLRGQKYLSAYKAFFAQEKESIRSKFFEIVERDGKFNAKALGEICNHFQVPVKLMDQYLPEITNFTYSTGTWAKLQDRGVLAKEIGVVWF